MSKKAPKKKRQKSGEKSTGLTKLEREIRDRVAAEIQVAHQRACHRGEHSRFSKR